MSGTGVWGVPVESFYKLKNDILMSANPDTWSMRSVPGLVGPVSVY